MKKLLSVFLALVMALALGTTALAATVTVPNDLNGHTFKAYQIFTGTQAESEGALGDVAWGTGINATNFMAALRTNDDTSKYFDKDTSEAITLADVLKALGKMAADGDTAAANAVAKLAYDNKVGTGTALTVGTNDLAKGYYLIVDESEKPTGDYGWNAALLQVTDKIEITLKTDKPSVEKKVQENEKEIEDGDYGNGYNDVADYNIGDNVPFKLIGTVPDMTYYDTYKYIFHDTLSAGLTLNENSIHVYVANDKAGTGKTEIPMTVAGDPVVTNWTKDVDGQSFDISFADLKTVANVSAGKYIIVEYTATLNDEAKIGLPGNENEVYLEYSNKPDQSGEGENHPTGETPEDKVIVFTYELDVTKIDGATADKGEDATKLKDAEFKLHNAAGKWVTVDKDGKVTGWSDTEAGGSTLTSDANGLFKVIGLDDGTYYLKETKAPAGYNQLTGEIEVVITAATSNNQNWNGTPGDALIDLGVTADGKAGTGNTETGIAGITVANNKGATLPETGGVGTTVFYVVGGVLMAAAVVLLVTKKKMSGEEN